SYLLSRCAERLNPFGKYQAWVKAFLVFFISLISLKAISQTDSSKTLVTDSVVILPDTANQKIYKSKQLVKGFYLNKDEFFNNRPSIKRNFSVTERTTSAKYKAAGILPVKYVLAEGEAPIQDKIWGFCDGSNVYAYSQAGLSSNINFWKLDCIGPHPFYVFPLGNDWVDISNPISFTVDMLSLAAGPSYEIFMLNKKGKFKKVYSEDLLELFEEEPDIQYDFKHALGGDIYEPNLNRSGITRIYLKKFNERLIENERL
ncbi:MAG: hypothetical protein V4685_13440, partial [Bacteroidota bacterium]